MSTRFKANCYEKQILKVGWRVACSFWHLLISWRLWILILEELILVSIFTYTSYILPNTTSLTLPNFTLHNFSHPSQLFPTQLFSPFPTFPTQLLLPFLTFLTQFLSTFLTFPKTTFLTLPNFSQDNFTDYNLPDLNNFPDCPTPRLPSPRSDWGILSFPTNPDSFQTCVFRWPKCWLSVCLWTSCRHLRRSTLYLRPKC